MPHTNHFMVLPNVYLALDGAPYSGDIPARSQAPFSLVTRGSAHGTLCSSRGRTRLGCSVQGYPYHSLGSCIFLSGMELLRERAYRIMVVPVTVLELLERDPQGLRELENVCTSVKCPPCAGK